jgi:hypothetical protein
MHAAMAPSLSTDRDTRTDGADEGVSFTLDGVGESAAGLVAVAEVPEIGSELLDALQLAHEGGRRRWHRQIVDPVTGVRLSGM